MTVDVDISKLKVMLRKLMKKFSVLFHGLFTLCILQGGSRFLTLMAFYGLILMALFYILFTLCVISIKHLGDPEMILYSSFYYCNEADSRISTTKSVSFSSFRPSHSFRFPVAIL